MATATSAVETWAHLPAEMVAALKAPLPREAVSQHPTKKYLSTIKVIYIVERLNDVFGLGRWFVHNEVVENSGTMVVVKATLTIPEYGIVVENFGGNDNVDRGDAYKGACTDALSKIASYLYVGMDVYKGHGDCPAQVGAVTAVARGTGTQETATASTAPSSPTTQQKDAAKWKEAVDKQPSDAIEVLRSAITKQNGQYGPYLDCAHTFRFDGGKTKDVLLKIFPKKNDGGWYEAIDSAPLSAKLTLKTAKVEKGGKTFLNIVGLEAIDGISWPEGKLVITDQDVPF